MTPSEARKAGASWGLSFARARFASDTATVDAYRRRRGAEVLTLPRDPRTAFWVGFDAAHDAEWVRLEETEADGNQRG